MFFKKKTPPQVFNPAMIFIPLATELYHRVGPADGSAALSATLEFDSEQKISHITNLKVNDESKLPSFDTVEALNIMTKPLASLPENQKIKTLAISVKDGNVATDVEYMVPAQAS